MNRPGFRLSFSWVTAILTALAGFARLQRSARLGTGASPAQKNSTKLAPVEVNP
jgi:hypothetical protein